MAFAPVSVRRLAAAIAIVALLAACGGSGSGPSTSTVAPPAAVLAEIGAAPPAGTVTATECASPDAPAVTGAGASARYPRSAGIFRGWPSGGTGIASDDATPLQLRGDRAGGYIASHRTGEGGAMFRITAAGDKSVLPLPYAATFDVAQDGRIWFVREGALSVATQGGSVRTLAQLGDPASTVDGPLGSSPVGPVSLIAAGRDTVYLLVESGQTDVSASPPASTITRSLRVISRAAPGQDLWTLRTVALPGDITALDVVSAMRVGPADELLLLLNQPFRQLESQKETPFGALESVYLAEASVRVRDPAGVWSNLASRSYTLTRTPSTRGWTTAWALDARDLGVSPSGAVVVGGAGGIHQVDAARGWTPIATPAGLPGDAIGREGAAAQAGFAGAAQLVPDAAGVVFYDGETCQVRRLEGDRLTTVSGPRVVAPGFAGAGLLGLNAAGELLVAWGDASGPAPTGRYAMQSGLARARLDDPAFVPAPIRSLAVAVGAPSCIATTDYRAQPTACTGRAPEAGAVAGYWLGPTPAGLLARRGVELRTGLDTGAGSVVGSTLTWPGVLAGDAPSGPSGVHLEGNALHVFGWVRTDPPVVPTSVYHELRLYRLDLGSGSASVVAGATIDSTAFAGRRVGLSAVIPEAGGGPALVQRRPDGGYWLSNGKELWLLDSQGQLRRIAGLATSGGGVDGSGSAASFGSIASIRGLPDNRLLVVDQGAHAVRLASDDGRVLTLVGQLNQAGQDLGALPARLASPVDVWPIGRDLYITTTGSRRLLKASSAL